jgi:Ca2+-dependent lipid-binding protein
VTANYEGWKLKWRFPVNAMTIKGWHRSKVIVQIRLGSAKVQLRELIFDSVPQAEQFRRELGSQHALEDRRRQVRLEAQLGGQRLDENEAITFLVEIVSGWNLPVGDVTTSDPFVKCTFNGTTIHETKHISKT